MVSYASASKTNVCCEKIYIYFFLNHLPTCTGDPWIDANIEKLRYHHEYLKQRTVHNTDDELWQQLCRNTTQEYKETTPSNGFRQLH